MKFLGALLIFTVACSPHNTDQSRVSGLVQESFDSKNCVFDSGDQFEPRSRLEKGPKAGNCLDSRVGRPVRRLSEAEVSKFGGSAPGVLAVANVSHMGEYYVAHIPVSKIKAGIFQLEYFPAIVPAGHTQLRLQFDENSPVTLVSQSTSSMTKVIKVHDLILSVEAIGNPGYKYDLFKGMEDHFAAIHRMTTLQDKYQHMIVNKKHRVEQWKLNLEPNELQRILPRHQNLWVNSGVGKSPSAWYSAI
jgi:hypothetical protein